MDIRIKELELIKSVLDKFKVRFAVVYGACLGFYRDGDFLPGDDDIDLAIIDPLDLKTRKDIGWTLSNLGFHSQGIAFNVFGRWEAQEEAYNGDDKSGIIVCEKQTKFTIFFFHKEQCEQHGEEYVCIPKLGSVKLISTPTRFYEKFENIKIGKQKYLIPSPIKDYLSFTYFNNWKDKTDRRHGDTYYDMHNANKES